VVFGEGSETAELMVVGEAPGENEDRQGRPFVGKAGQLLDLLLMTVGFPRETVYICNVLKCRPPGNRNPAPDEVEACSPYLLKQVELVRPKVIMAFGTFAAQTLLGTDVAIGRLRGRVHSYHGTPLVPTYHPAALLRNSGWVRAVWDDLQRARSVLDSNRA
jgi:DNA polymerase